MTIDAMRAYERRFEQVLALLDEASDGDGDIEELNANLEDALFVIHCIEDRDGEDEARQAFADALDEIEELAQAYAALPEGVPEDVCARLKACAEAARREMEGA